MGNRRRDGIELLLTNKQRCNFGLEKKKLFRNISKRIECALCFSFKLSSVRFRITYVNSQIRCFSKLRYFYKTYNFLNICFDLFNIIIFKIILLYIYFTYNIKMRENNNKYIYIIIRDAF